MPLLLHTLIFTFNNNRLQDFPQMNSKSPIQLNKLSFVFMRKIKYSNVETKWGLPVLTTCLMTKLILYCQRKM